MALKDIAGNIMDYLTNMDKEDNSLMVNEGGKKIFPFEPNVWEISSEKFDSTSEGGDSVMDIFLSKGKQTALDAPEDYEGITRITDALMAAEGEKSGQPIEQFIEQTATNNFGETWLEGKTKSGKDYRFILHNDIDEDTGEMVYKINDDRFDKENYEATIKNITEKLDNVSLAVSEKFEKGGALSGEEYLTAAEQEPKITVEEPYPSSGERPTSGYYSKKKPFWASK